MFSKITNTFRRVTSAINPFAKVQVEVEDEISFVPERNIFPYFEKIYPNSVKKERGILRPHSNIEEDQQLGSTFYRQRIKGDLEYIPEPKFNQLQLPLSCTRHLKKFKRCQLVNGKDNCSDEGKEFLEICPNSALSEMRKEKLINENAKFV